MDGRLSFDVYAVITDSPWQVEHEAFESRVSVTIGRPPGELGPTNMLHLWLKDPDTVMAMGRELTTAGMRLAAQLRTSVPDSTVSGQGSMEEYPVPGTKPTPNRAEPGEER
jgi:hypothetical protein